MSEDNCCSQEIEKLRDELKIWTHKCDNSKLDYGKKLIENLKKDILISELKKTFSASSKANKFESFEQHLSESVLRQLKTFGDTSKEDSSFISCAVKDLYRDNVELIKKLSLSGRIEGKTQISQENKAILEKLFAERLSYIPSSEVDEVRRQNLNKLIRNVIDCANKKKRHQKE